MPTVYPYRGGFRAIVRVKGFPQKSQTFPEHADAIAWASHTEQSLKPQSIAYTGSKTIWQVWELYKEIRLPKKAPQTQRGELAVIKRLFDLYDYGMDNITPQLLQQRFDKRAVSLSKRGKRLSPDTIRLERALLSNLFNFGVLRAYAKSNPCKGVPFDLPTPEPREIRFSAEDQLALLAAAEKELRFNRKANPCIYPWLYLVTMTGSRPGDACRITIDQIKDGYIEFSRKTTKNREPRRMLLDTDTNTVVKMQLNRAIEAKSPYWVWSVYKGEIKPYSYAKAYQRLCKLAKVEYRIPHGLRHEYISRLFEETNLESVQISKLSGHKHTLSLKSYEHIRVEKLRGVMQEQADNRIQGMVRASLDKSSKKK
jgi:integrase